MIKNWEIVADTDFNFPEEFAVTDTDADAVLTFWN